MTDYTIIIDEQTSVCAWSLASAFKEAKYWSRKNGKSQLITEKPYFYKGYRFWMRDSLRTFVDGVLVDEKATDLLFGAISGEYIPLEQWKVEQDKYFHENMKEEWLKENY